ncbi:hypothetical protein VH86_23710 [Pantoea sp. BL1]|nr:hypothetical protein VH86_23710 [Pantoea sp. BL1]HAU5564374.1 hypothetical protein [Serratia fonticola]
MTSIRHLLCALAILSLCGCTVLLWGVNPPTSQKMKYKKIASDNIDGVYRYKGLQASVVNDGVSYPVDIPPDGLAFSGKENIYVVTVGGEHLLETDALHSRYQLELKENDNKIKLTLVSPATKRSVASFEGGFEVIARSHSGMISPCEAKDMQSIGFHYSDNICISNIKIKGVIIPEESLNFRGAQQTKTVSQYKIELWANKQVTDIHADNILTNVVLTPVAAAADIIFFPISLTFLKFMIDVGSFK